MKIALMLLLLAAPLCAQSTRWVRLAGDAEGSLLLDTSSVVRETPNVVKVWVKHQFTHAHPLSDTDTRLTISWLSRSEIDCEARTIKGVSFTQYGQDGTVLHASETPNAAFLEVEPESIGENIVIGVCKYVHSH